MTHEIGSLPPMKIHCGQMVEGALKSALETEDTQKTNNDLKDQSTLAQSLIQQKPTSGKIKVIPISDNN